MRNWTQMKLLKLWNVYLKWLLKDQEYDYTQELTKKINRGGLFEVNESTFLLFCFIEFKVRQLLNDTLAKRERGRHREKLLSELITADEDILFYWSMNSGLLPNDGMGLLKEILSMWLTIRGHSIAGSWMETYKSLNKARVKKKRSAGLLGGVLVQVFSCSHNSWECILDETFSGP